MNPLEIRIIAYGLMACGIVSAASYATHKLDSARYESLQAEFSQYQARVEADNAMAQKAARDVLQAQIDAHQEVEAHNAQIIASMQSQIDGAQRDAEFARRLLNAATASPGATTPGHPMPKTDSGHQSDGPAPASGDRSLAADLGDAAGECRDAIQRLAALQLELTPQL